MLQKLTDLWPRLLRGEQEALQDAKKKHAAAQRARDEAVAAGHGHWVECYDPASDAYYYYETYRYLN